MDGQNKLTAYTIPAHHVTQTNLLKSKQISKLKVKATIKDCEFVQPKPKTTFQIVAAITIKQTSLHQKKTEAVSYRQ